MQNLNFFKRLPKDVQSGSSLGGIFTIVAFLLGLYLTIQEYWLYKSVRKVRELHLDHSLNETQVNINLDISFYNTPCQLLTICWEDDLGHHISGVPTVNKKMIDKSGKILGEYKETQTESYYYNEKGKEEIKKAIDDAQGCYLYGKIEISKVPGDFHISYHQRKEILYSMEDEYFKKVNLDYKIHHLSFGSDLDNAKILKYWPEKSLHLNHNPYDHTEFKAEGKAHNKMSQNNFIKIVANNYLLTAHNHQKVKTYQFSMNTRDQLMEDPRQLIAVYFNYEFTPISILYYFQKHSFTHLLVQLCAIVGGVFSVIGILNTILSELSDAFKN